MNAGSKRLIAGAFPYWGSQVRAHEPGGPALCLRYGRTAWNGQPRKCQQHL